MTNHPFDLKGIDTGKIGGNKYVNYTLEDFMMDQDLSRSGAVRALGQKQNIAQTVLGEEKWKDWLV